MAKQEHTLRVYRLLTQHVLLEVGDEGWSDKGTSWQHVDAFTANGGWELVSIAFVPDMRNYDEPGGYAVFRRPIAD